MSQEFIRNKLLNKFSLKKSTECFDDLVKNYYEEQFYIQHPNGNPYEKREHKHHDNSQI